jgi:PadR family transcriptional regulator, regulatory protein PadR
MVGGVCVYPCCPAGGWWCALPCALPTYRVALQLYHPYLSRLRGMRTTHALVQIAQVLLADPHGRHWGYDTAKKAGVRTGVLYPVLSRLHEAGWVTDGWEDPALTAPRPPRRYYQLTNLGRAELGRVLADASTDPRFASLNLKGDPMMDESMLRWLCTAMLKASGGEPVRLTPDEATAPFDLKFEVPEDSQDIIVSVTAGDEEGET